MMRVGGTQRDRAANSPQFHPRFPTTKSEKEETNRNSTSTEFLDIEAITTSSDISNPHQIHHSMSVRDLLTQHLDDFVLLLDQLLISISKDPSQTELKMLALARKESLIQLAVEKLVRHQRMQAKIKQAQLELAVLDEVVIDFARQLGRIEQGLYDAVTDKTTLKDLDGLVTKQRFSVDEMLTFAQRAAHASFSPDQYEERTMGLNRRRLPPCPTLGDRAEIQGSYLHLSVEEMLTKIEEEEAAITALEAQEQAEKDGASAVGGFPSHEQIEAELSTLPEAEAPADWVAPTQSLMHWRERPRKSVEVEEAADAEDDDSDDSDLLDMGF